MKTKIGVNSIVHTRDFTTDRRSKRPVLYVVQSEPYLKNKNYFVKVRRRCYVRYPLSKIEEEKMLSSLVATGEVFIPKI